MIILLVALFVWVVVIPVLVAFGASAVIASARRARRRSAAVEELAEVIPFDPAERGSRARLGRRELERLSRHPAAPVA